MKFTNNPIINRVANMIIHLVGLIIVAYMSMVVSLYIFQRKIMYVPHKEISTPETYGLNAREISLQAEDGTNIYGWFIPPNLKKGEKAEILLYFHGNAGNISHRAGKINNFAKNGRGVFIVSYRGYGKSEGSPTEAGLYEDGRAAIKWLNEQGYKNEQIILYGESLGTGVATEMAYEFNNFKALILEAPYISIAQIAQELYPFIPAKILTKDKFDNLKKIDQIKIPILFFHGRKDNVVPFAHGVAVYEKAIAPKEAIYFDDVGHNDFNIDDLAKRIDQFIAKY